MGGQRGTQANHSDPWMGRQIARRKILSLGSSKDSPHVRLSQVRLAELVVAVAAHQMPFLAEVMIETRDPVVIALRQPDAGSIADRVEGIADGRGRSQIISGWHV